MNRTQLTTAAQPPAAPKAVTPTEGARVLWTFVYFFIVSAEWELLGGEFGHEKCHETLSSAQTSALRQALRAAEEVVQRFEAEAESLWHLGARLSKLADELGSNPSLDPDASRALRRGLDSAISEAARMADPKVQLNGTSEAPPRRVHDLDGSVTVQTLRTCAANYLGDFVELIDTMVDPDGALGRAAVEEVFVCTDTGLGIVSALQSFLLDHQLSAQEFVNALEEQLQRSTVQEARRNTQLFLADAARGALIALH